MMKNYLALLFLVLGCLNIKAQEIPPAVVHEPGGKFSSAPDLARTLRLNSAMSFEQTALIQSPIGKHYTFQPLLNGLPVYGRELRVHLNNKGEILLVTENLGSTLPVSGALPSLAQARNVVTESGWNIDGTLTAWLFDNSNTFQPAWQIPCRRGAELKNLWVGETGILQTHSRGLYQQEPDSQVTGWVHYPDPISSSGQPYGGNYIDNNDADNPFLNAERKAKSMRVAFVNDTFFLRNAHGVIVDFEPPNNSQPWALTPEFNYNRSEEGFEGVNALYHVSEINARLRQLGFNNLMNYQIRIDPQGRYQTDNSVYLSGDSVISFGEGGIDDAEDADPIVHEYFHAITQDAAPNTVTGLQRQSVEEGNADFFAVSYSLTMSTYDANKVYNWDGNDTWNGRTVRSSKMYPNNIVSDFYQNAEIWSEALVNLRELTNRDIAETLLLQSLFFYGKNLSMPQLASFILKTDSLLYGGNNEAAIYEAFRRKGILEWPVSVKKEPLNSTPLLLLNSAGFSNGSAKLGILSLYDTKLVITDGLGRELLNTSLTGGTVLELDPQNWVPGIYYCRTTYGVQRLLRN